MKTRKGRAWCPSPKWYSELAFNMIIMTVEETIKNSTIYIDVPCWKKVFEMWSNASFQWVIVNIARLPTTLVHSLVGIKTFSLCCITKSSGGGKGFLSGPRAILPLHPLQREMLPCIKHNQNGLSTSVRSTSDVSGGRAHRCNGLKRRLKRRPKVSLWCLNTTRCDGKRFLRYMR